MVNEVNAAVNGKDATIHDVDVLKNFVVFYGKEKEKQKMVSTLYLEQFNS